MKKNNKNNYFYVILFIIIIVILIIFYLFNLNKNKKENFIANWIPENTNMTYFRCPEKDLGTITKNIFQQNNITNNNNSNWNIYVPCGYNNVEEELKTILIGNNPYKQKYIFGLNGCDSIVSKNKIWESLVNCFGRKRASTLMPESYVLDNRDDMMDFEKQFKNNNTDIYILKKNVQRKEGLKLTTDFFEINNAKNENYKVVQKYMTDLYLINGYKVNLRIYVLVINKNGIIEYYISKLGKCIYTNKKYNHNDFDFESNITSYNLDMNIYKDNPRDFDELYEYISEKSGKQNAELLFKNIDVLFKDMAVCLKKNIYQSTNIKGTTTFQLFGADVIFNNNFHPYLLEMNKGPDMSSRDGKDEIMKTSVQKDMFKMVGVIPDNNNMKNSFYLLD